MRFLIGLFWFVRSRWPYVRRSKLVKVMNDLTAALAIAEKDRAIAEKKLAVERNIWMGFAKDYGQTIADLRKELTFKQYHIDDRECAIEGMRTRIADLEFMLHRCRVGYGQMVQTIKGVAEDVCGNSNLECLSTVPDHPIKVPTAEDVERANQADRDRIGLSPQMDISKPMGLKPCST